VTVEEGTLKSLGNCTGTEGDYNVLQWDSREDCDVRQILDRIADKWSLLVIELLGDGPRRFMELRREIPHVSKRMLAHTTTFHWVLAAAPLSLSGGGVCVTSPHRSLLSFYQRHTLGWTT
jgi:hypothetical protein